MVRDPRFWQCGTLEADGSDGELVFHLYEQCVHRAKALVCSCLRGLAAFVATLCAWMLFFSKVSEIFLAEASWWLPCTRTSGPSVTWFTTYQVAVDTSHLLNDLQMLLVTLGGGVEGVILLGCCFFFKDVRRYACSSARTFSPSCSRTVASLLSGELLHRSFLASARVLVNRERLVGSTSLLGWHLGCSASDSYHFS